MAARFYSSFNIHHIGPTARMNSFADGYPQFYGENGLFHPDADSNKIRLPTDHRVATALKALRGGLGNLNRPDKWIFCSPAA